MTLSSLLISGHVSLAEMNGFDILTSSVQRSGDNDTLGLRLSTAVIHYRACAEGAESFHFRYYI